MGVTHRDGISVTGSGYYVGPSGVERLIINTSGFIQSGYVTGSSLLSGAVIRTAIGSGVIAVNQMGSGSIGTTQLIAEGVTFAKLAAGVKIDGGNVGVSGALLSVSTRLSSILGCAGVLEKMASGLNDIRVVASGHALAFYTYYGDGVASDLSTRVNWIAVGN